MKGTFAKRTYAQQLAGQLGELIRTGQWAVEQRTPSIRQLSRQYAVSPRTVHQALQQLERDRLLVRSSTGRFHVAADAGLVAVQSQFTDSQRSNDQGSSTQTRLMHIGMPGLSYQPGSLIRDEWIGRIALSADQTLNELGGLCSTRIYSPDHDPQRNIDQTLEQLERLAPQLDGVILFPRCCSHMKAQIALCDRLGLPWVSINGVDNIIYNFVATDNLQCGRIAGQCFLARGMDHILLLGAQMVDKPSWRAKIMGVYEAFVMAGRSTANLEFMDCHEHQLEAGYDAMTDYLKRNSRPPQAIFGVGDPICLGAMHACQERGLKVPDDVSVIGSTGTQIAQTASPAMTVVAQPMEQIGQAAVRMLVRMIQTGERRLPGKLLHSQLVVRQSFRLDDSECQMIAQQGVPLAATS